MFDPKHNMILLHLKNFNNYESDNIKNSFNKILFWRFMRFFLMHIGNIYFRIFSMKHRFLSFYIYIIKLKNMFGLLRLSQELISLN